MGLHLLLLLCAHTREGVDNGLFINLVPSFLIRWLKNFGNFYWILIGWFIMLSVPTFQLLILIYRRGNFLYIIGDVHQFISHCLFPWHAQTHTHTCSPGLAMPNTNFMAWIAVMWIREGFPGLGSGSYLSRWNYNFYRTLKTTSLFFYWNFNLF